MTFDPTRHGFLKLDFAFPGGVPVYERDLEGIDQPAYDKMRLNCYLAQDGDFVTVWYGLIDAHMTGISLGFGDDPTFDFTAEGSQDTAVLQDLKYNPVTFNLGLQFRF